MAKLNADLLDDLTIKAAKFGDKPNPLRDGINETNREKTNQLEEAIRRGGNNFTISPVSLPDDITLRGNTDFAAAEKIAGIFGKKIAWVRADGNFSINGAIPQSLRHHHLLTDRYYRVYCSLKIGAVFAYCKTKSIQSIPSATKASKRSLLSKHLHA